MRLSMDYKPFLAMMVILLLSCFASNAVAQSGDNVSYKEYPYFSTLKNAKDGTLTLVIKSEKDLERVFGHSGFIGPTPRLDFETSFIIAVVVPKNIAQATIEPVSLKRNGNKLVFSYCIDPVKKTNESSRSYTAIVVDRSQPMKVDFQEVSKNGAPQNLPNDLKALRKQVEYLTSENEELKKNVQGLLEENQKLEAQRLYYINTLKELEAEIENLKKHIRH